MTNKNNHLAIILALSLSSFLIIVILLFALFKSKSVETFPEQNSEIISEYDFENQDGSTPSEEVDLEETILPSEGGEFVFPEMDLILTLPAGWAVTEQNYLYQEKIMTVGNGNFSLRLTKDPIFTGGGFGFNFDGMQNEFGSGLTLESKKISIANAEAYIFNEIVELEALKKVNSGAFVGENENLPSGKYFSSAVVFAGNKIAQNPVKIGTSSYLISLYPKNIVVNVENEGSEYQVSKYFSIDSTEYIEAMNDVEEILANMKKI